MLKEYVVSEKRLEGILNEDLLVCDLYTVYAVSGFHSIVAFCKDNGLREELYSYEKVGIESNPISACLINGKNITFVTECCIVKQLEFPF